MMRQINSLGQKEAELAIQAVKKEAEKRNNAIVIAVGDAFGELLALLRMDGAPLPSTVIATNKVWTAARERVPSSEIGRRFRDPQSTFAMTNYGDSRYLSFGGGVPVVVNGEVVGAVSVSGLHESEDEELAKIGIDVILGTLKV
jgi:glc operon protein GlcG